MAKKKQEKNMLDEVKELDRKIRKYMVYEKLDDLRDWAREVLEIKEKTQIWLEELGVEKTDIKRIIDYVNEDVALTKEDKKEIRDEIRDRIRGEKREIKKDTKVMPQLTATMPVSDSNTYTVDTSSSNTMITSGLSGIDFTVE